MTAIAQGLWEEAPRREAQDQTQEARESCLEELVTNGRLGCPRVGKEKSGRASQAGRPAGGKAQGHNAEWGPRGSQPKLLRLIKKLPLFTEGGL